MTKREKILRITLFALIVLTMSALIWYMARPMIRFVDEPARFQLWIRERGVWGVTALVLMRFLQVFAAVIPSGPLSLAAGYAFGPLLGTAICVLSDTAAAMLLVLLVRRFGPRVLRLLTGKDPEQYRLFQKRQGLGWLLLALFLIPGTPKDVMTYAVGMADLSLWAWLGINLVGRIPGVALSVYGGSSLSRGEYGLLIALCVLCALLYPLGAYFYKKHTAK